MVKEPGGAKPVAETGTGSKEPQPSPAGGRLLPHGTAVVFYDGVCGLCNRLVQFVLKRDRMDRFRFAALQGVFASDVLPRHGKNPADLNTLYLLLDPGEVSERVLERGRAVLRIFSHLGGPWKATGAVFGILPTWLLDAVYGLVAKNRYRLFGKRESCLIPEPRHRAKFILP